MKLKNLVVSIFIISISIMSYAQEPYNYIFDWKTYYMSCQPIIYSPPENVKQITFTKENCKGKSESYIKKYDSEGRLSEYHKSRKKNRILPYITYDYHKLTEYINKIVEYDKKGKIKNIIQYERNEKGIPIMQKFINSKGIVTLQNTWVFDNDNKLLKSKRYKKGGEKTINTWVYEYDKEGERTKTLLLNKKGKVVYEWTFDCNEKGTKLEKIKDQTQVCTWSEEENEFLIRVYQTIDEKGEIVKRVSKYTIKDTLIIEYTLYNSKDELQYKASFDKDFDKLLYSENYYKGKLTHKQINEYSGGYLVKEEHYNKKGFSYRLEYEYDKDNFLIKLKRFNKDNELYSTINLKYLL